MADTRRVLVTGTAGFIGFHIAQLLMKEGFRVHGFDGMTDYYDVTLKDRRHQMLMQTPGFSKTEAMLEDTAAFDAMADEFEPQIIIHLAAQAGVRYSLENPRAYIDANVVGTFNVMEAARRHKVDHLLMASTSSAYGANTEMPYREVMKTDTQLTIYAATKKATEAMGHSYAHLWNLPTTMFRFFTVYGPWGRPDMAPYIFTKALFEGRTIQLFNYGRQRRDFTFIDDIVAGVIGAIGRPLDIDNERAAHRIYNLGNNNAEALEDFVSALEIATGKQAILERVAAQPGDVVETFADIARSKSELGFTPKTSMAAGLTTFVDWYRDYHAIT
ncbi:MAG: NAD-dependent epimerase/dehydratase family protein [Pseudomonadota bacterium]